MKGSSTSLQPWNFRKSNFLQEVLVEWCQGPCTAGLVARGKAKQSSRNKPVPVDPPSPSLGETSRGTGLSFLVSARPRQSSGGSSQSPEPSQERINALSQAGKCGWRDALCEPHIKALLSDPSLLPGDKGQEESRSVPQCGSSFSHLKLPKVFSTDTVESPAQCGPAAPGAGDGISIAMDITSFPWDISNQSWDHH